MNDSQRFDLLKNVWVPSKNYVFPLLQKFEARGLKFCYKWLEEFSWLTYSELHQGAFCISCVAFAKSGGKGPQTLGHVYNFLHTPKRKAILENTIEEPDETLRTKSLKRLNLTRWVSKYEAVNDFFELFPFVYETLDAMRTSGEDAKNLKNAMDFEVLICLHIINVIFQLSLPLSRELQKVNLDLVQAMDLAKDLREEVKKIRAKEDAFSAIYEASKKIAENLDIEIKHKRIARRQKNRANPEVQSTEDYFRVTAFNPFLDFYIMDLGERFTKHENILEGFSALFKHDLNEIDKVADKFIKTVEFYQEFFTAGPHAGLVELKMWKRYLIRKGDIKPGNSLDALDHCPQENFPNINVLLRILATLPVSTSTAERTFSSLKRIKTILRNTTKEISFFKILIFSLRSINFITKLDIYFCLFFLL